MIQSTRGIVLKYYPYSETSIIVKIFTENFGLQSFIIKGIGSKKSGSKLAIFQPLNLVEFAVNHNENKSIHYLKDPCLAYNYQTFSIDLNKRSILFFLAELLFKTIREESPDKPLFEWLFNTLTWFDLSEKNILNFHLIFMIQLCRFLGFSPKDKHRRENYFFDVLEGEFTDQQPSHPQYIGGNNAKQLFKLYSCSFENSDSVNINTADRRRLIDLLVSFYQLHMPGFGEMKSLEVLKVIT
jgi:DNA repair protein RecO (recombination protein O)